MPAVVWMSSTQRVHASALSGLSLFGIECDYVAKAGWEEERNTKRRLYYTRKTFLVSAYVSGLIDFAMV